MQLNGFFRCGETGESVAAVQYPETKLLQQVKGIGPLVAF
jgi:hypothetical protein